MSVVSFLVGFTASGVASFAIVEMLADRRCLSFRRRSHEEFILSSIYKAKLSELVRSEERSQQSESVLEAQARQLVHQYVVPAVNDSTSAVNGFVQKHVSGFSFANLFNSVSTGGAKK